MSLPLPPEPLLPDAKIVNNHYEQSLRMGNFFKLFKIQNISKREPCSLPANKYMKLFNVSTILYPKRTSSPYRTTENCKSHESQILPSFDEALSIEIEYATETSSVREVSEPIVCPASSISGNHKKTQIQDNRNSTHMKVINATTQLAKNLKTHSHSNSTFPHNYSSTKLMTETSNLKTNHPDKTEFNQGSTGILQSKTNTKISQENIITTNKYAITLLPKRNTGRVCEKDEYKGITPLPLCVFMNSYSYSIFKTKDLNENENH